jgi:hypothetical protein
MPHELPLKGPLAMLADYEVSEALGRLIGACSALLFPQQMEKL